MENQFNYFIGKPVSIRESEGKELVCMLLEKETKKHLVGTKLQKRFFSINRITHPKNKILSVSTLKTDNTCSSTK